MGGCVVRHFADSSWVDGWVGGCPIAPPPTPCGGGAFTGLWVYQQCGWVGGSLKSPPPTPPLVKKNPVHGSFMGLYVLPLSPNDHPTMAQVSLMTGRKKKCIFHPTRIFRGMGHFASFAPAMALGKARGCKKRPLVS